MVSGFQACMKRQLKGKHIKGKTKWRAAFKKAAKKCARGTKVKAKYTRPYKKHKKGKKHKKAKRKGSKRMKRVGTIVCRLK